MQVLVLFFEISECSVAIVEASDGTPTAINLLNLAYRGVTRWLLIYVISGLLPIQRRVLEYFFLRILL